MGKLYFFGFEIFKKRWSILMSVFFDLSVMVTELCCK